MGQGGHEIESSPRPWGCFLHKLPLLAGANVFPTPVGVFLEEWNGNCVFCSLPHARGGVSFYVLFNQIIKESSPRPWGCFWSGTLEGIFPVVFPTPVGVFLRDIHACDYGFSLPHARGGVS